MAKSGASNGAKKIDAFNEGNLEGVNVALNQGPSTPVRVYSDGDSKWVAPIKQPFKIRKMKV